MCGYTCMASFGAQSWQLFAFCLGFFVSTYLLYYYTEVILLIHIKYILCVQGHHVYSMVAFMSIFEPSSKVLADFFICFIESQMIVNFK